LRTDPNFLALGVAMLSVSQTLALSALVGKVWCDEVSLMQDVRSRLAIQRPAQHSSAGLVEVATNMLKHGSGGTAADDFVGEITLNIMGDVDCDVGTATFTACESGIAACVIGGQCTPGALAYIQHQHQIDQASITSEHAKFQQALSNLEASNVQVAQLRNEEATLSEEHLKCRHDATNALSCDGESKTDCDEQKLCTIKIKCDTLLWSYWDTWYTCETELSDYHLKFRNHFCDLVPPGGGNSTDPNWRLTSVTHMDSWTKKEVECRGYQVVYDNQVTICRKDYTYLVAQGAACDTKQDSLQQKSCVYASKVKSVVDAFLAEWKRLDDAYGWYLGDPKDENGTVRSSPPVRPHGNVHRVKLLEWDRISEYTTLDVVKCLMEEVRKKNGQPCDETTAEATGILGRCQNRRFSTDVSHLNITYPPPPPVRRRCNSMLPNSVARSIYPVDDKAVDVCLPVEQPRPCSAAYTTQEFAFGGDAPLPTFPSAPFSCSASACNPACNPQPACNPLHVCPAVVGDVSLPVIMQD